MTSPLLLFHHLLCKHRKKRVFILFSWDTTCQHSRDKKHTELCGCLDRNQSKGWSCERRGGNAESRSHRSKRIKVTPKHWCYIGFPIYWHASAKSFFFSLVLSTGSQLGASAQNHTWLQNAPCMSATLTRAKTTINNPKIEITKDEKQINAKKKSGGGIRKHLKFLVVKEKLTFLCNKMTPKSRLFFRKRSNCSNT